MRMILITLLFMPVFSFAQPMCEVSGEATCDDGLDNDGDGHIDCGDIDCSLNFQTFMDCSCEGQANNPEGCIVFVTSTLHAGTFGGVDPQLGFDICQDAAAKSANPDLRGRFLPWLSDNDFIPFGLFQTMIGENKYVLPDGTQIADNFTDILNCDEQGQQCLEAAINIDEFGNAIDPNSETRVWTGNIIDDINNNYFFGNFFVNCGFDQQTSYWTNSDISGTFGNALSTDFGWAVNDFETVSCTTPLRIYCFQQ